ncbi:MAG: radical SAM protein [Candidatus Omnitrophica bacterium]|nr:radical SAM protein [Candidatus Omnitrophota bacterium]MDD5352364.1 radical SAM protein [Candidatus Omnitrophota bacterium]MDD5549962.1 radical SAM protein [Candidatus Omnitrophota bacterium]
MKTLVDNKIVLIRPSYSNIYEGIYRKIPKNREIRPPLGLLSLAGSLEKEGFNVTIIDGEPFLLNSEEIAEEALHHNPSFVGITSTTPEYHIALEIAEFIKNRNSKITIVFGGAHVSALPEESLAEAKGIIDYIVTGEGEQAIVYICKNKPKEKILHFPLIGNLNLLPLPSKHLIDYKNYRHPDPISGLVKTDAIETSRGCPFKCSFCFHLFGEEVRFKNPFQVVSEIEHSYKKLGVRMIIFFDDTFTLKRERVVTICNEVLRKRLKLSFFCFTRADVLDKELLTLMKKAGFDKITLGIESGNQEILNRMNKITKLEHYEKAYKIMNKLGIETRGSFIIGNPGETPQTIQDSINFAKKLPLFKIGVNILTPYPGTDLYKDALSGRNGIRLVCKDWKDFKRWGNSVIETKALTKKELEKYQRKFLQEFYSSKKVIMYHIKQFLSTPNHSFYYYRPVIEAVKERLKEFPSSLINIFITLIKVLYQSTSCFFTYFVWLYRYLKLIKGFNTLKDIKILSIEFCSVCNLKCKYCFLEQLNRPKYLDINIYEKLIKEICENKKYNIKVMEWPIGGEFFLCPEYKKVIEITRDYMNKYPNFSPHIILNDNMVLMDEDKIDLVLKSGIIKQIICSIDGYDETSFEEMRPPAKFQTIMNNMRLLTKRNEELGHPVFVQINNGRDKNSSGKEISEHMKEIFQMADYVSFWKPQNWNESFKTEDKVFSSAKGFCSFVFNNVTLNSSGKISKCCMDLKGLTEYADFSKDTLENIWHSMTRKQFINLMLRGKRQNISGCNRCSITYTNNDNRYNNTLRIIKNGLLRLIYGNKYYLKQLR